MALSFFSPDGRDLKDDDIEETYMEGPALPNTLESTLQIFPLAETRASKGVKRSHRESCEASDNVMKQVLFPTGEELLGDSFDRVCLEDHGRAKRRRLERGFESCAAVDRMNERVQAMLEMKQVSGVKVRIGGPGVPVRFKSRLKTSEQKQVLAAVPNPKTFSYMIPNQFNVRMVTPYQLFPYQVSTVQWMMDVEEGKITNENYDPERRGGLLAMVMGLGKTPTSATVVMHTLNLQRMQQSATLYVCPKNLLGTIRNEFEKFFGDQAKVLVYHSHFLRSQYTKMTAKDLRQYDVVITNYATVTARMNSAGKFVKEPSKFITKKTSGPVATTTPGDRFLQAKPRVGTKTSGKVDPSALAFVNFPWFRIILDESHEIRERNTKRFKAVNFLRSPRRWCMTGTPIHNRTADLFNQLIFTGLQLPKGTTCSKASLKSMGLMKMIRWVEYKDAKMVKLPPKHMHKVYFDLSKEERFLHGYYMKNAQRIFREIAHQTGRSKGKKTIEAHVSMIRVMQVCSAPYIITPAAKQEAPSGDDLCDSVPVTVFPTDDNIDQWIKRRDGPAGLGSSKLQKFVSLMRELRETATDRDPLKIVVFANYKSTLRLAIAALEAADAQYDQKHVFVHGGITSTYKREELYTQFRVSPYVEALFMPLKLGGVGLNLTEANRVILLEPWYAWSPIHQAICRVYRIGQMREVDIYQFMASDSAEERVYRIAQNKKDLAEDVAAAQEKKLGVQDMEFILFNPEPET